MDTLDELERLLAEADLDTLSVETVPTSIGCCHKIGTGNELARNPGR